MRFTGRTAFTMTCYRNGRVARRFDALVVERSAKRKASAVPAPLLKIRRDGTFYGAGTHSVKPGAAPRETIHYHFAGHLTGKGTTAVGKFFANNCSSTPFQIALATAPGKHVRAASSGLVAAYGFDEGSGTTVTDASGNGNNGTITNATWSTSGKYGKALQFNGTSALVTIPDAASLHLTSGMTLEAWVNPSTVNAKWRDVIYKGNDNYYLSATSTNASRPDAGLIAGGTYADAFGTAKLSANTWSFLTETYDGSTVRLYVNGTQVASTAHTGNIATSTNPLQIGGDSIYGQYFAGLIDNVRVYNTALSAAQIQTDQTTAVTSGPDTTAPTQPGTPNTTVVSSSEIDLTWAASTDPDSPVSYQVWRCQGSGCTNFTQIATPTSASYNDTNLTASTSYTYEIRATDPSNNLSPFSGTASATTQATDTTAPTQPGTPNTTVVSSSEIDLTWAASTDPDSPVSYQVWRCQGSGCTNFTQIATPTSASYNDTNLTASTSYTYEIRATDPSNNLSPFSGTASNTTKAAASGLVAAYGFDEGSGTTVTDASGNGNNGTITNATWSTSGKYGKALQFNGTSALVTIPDAASLHLTTGLTLEAWVNPSTVNANWRDVIYKGNDNYYLSATSTNASSPDAGLIAGGTYADAFGTSALPTNTWSFLTETYDGSTVRLYVNGTQVASTAHTGNIATSTNPLQIGGDSIYGQYFAGLIDNVRVYNTALSAAQIQADQTTAVTSGPDTTAPTQPGTPNTTVVSSSEIDLTWAASTDPDSPVSYQVWRCQGSGCTNFTQIATPTSASYNDTNLTASTSYTYEIRATDPSNNLSPFSGTASNTTQATDTTAPTQPGTPNTTVVSSSEIDLTWAASTDPDSSVSYQVWRCQGSGCTNFTQIAAPTSASYNDTNLTASTSYTYEIRATDPSNNLSPFSGTASNTTKAAASGLVAAYGFDAGVGDDGDRCVGEREQRHDHERDVVDVGQVRQGVAVQRHQRAGHDPRRGIATSDHWADAGGVGEPVDGQRQLARRGLQGQRQLLPVGNLDQRVFAGRGSDRWRHLRRRVRHLRTSDQHLVVPYRDL